MVALIARKSTLLKLRKEVTELKRKEKLSRKKLRRALVQARKASVANQHKLDQKIKKTQLRVAADRAVYKKLINAIKKKVEQMRAKLRKDRIKSVGMGAAKRSHTQKKN